MKRILVYNILLLAGCASTPVDCVTSECVKEQAKKEVFRSCMANAKSYGYPVDVSDWAFARINLNMDIRPHPAKFCRLIAEHRIK